jgi:hypothetical protein
MQIKHRAFQKGGSGDIKLVPEHDEDVWHLYNLIMAGDEVRASTSRKVQVRIHCTHLSQHTSNFHGLAVWEAVCTESTCSACRRASHCAPVACKGAR